MNINVLTLQVVCNVILAVIYQASQQQTVEKAKLFCELIGLILRVENIVKFNETVEFNNFWCNDKFKRVAGKSMNFRQNITEISNMQF